MHIAWKTMDGVSWQGTENRCVDHPQEKQMQKGKMVIWGGLTNSCERREVKGKEEKERYTHLMHSSKEYQGEIRKPSSMINAKK